MSTGLCYCMVLLHMNFQVNRDDDIYNVKNVHAVQILQN